MKPRLTFVLPGSPLVLPDKAAKKLEKNVAALGYSPYYGKAPMHVDRFLAGADRERAIQLMSAFKDPKTEVIMALRGGYGSARILDKLDWRFIQNHHKLFVGFSDATLIQNAFIAKAKMPSITGFVAKFWAQKVGNLTHESLAHVLGGEGVTLEGLTGMTRGTATGIMVGGCLTSFVELVGTPYMPSLKGKILILEECGEEPYVVDRMMTHLKNAGVFDRVAGVILGEFYQCVSSPHNRKDGSVARVLQDHFSKLKIPVVSGVPYTHGFNGIVLPFGTKTFIDANKGIIRVDGLAQK